MGTGYTLSKRKKGLVGKFENNAINGLALQYNGKDFEKYMRMENNKIIKVYENEEIERVKKQEEYMKLMIFIDDVKLRIYPKNQL